MSTHQPRRFFTLNTGAAVLASALLLTACGERPPEKKATQVAAKVNGSEISVHQVNFLIQRMPGIQSTQAEAVQRQVLEHLVDQELAIQQALEGKLDRTPEVMQAIETARREVLTRAYLDQTGAAKATPTGAEVRQYYAENPALFAERKVYRLEEGIFASAPEAVASVKDQIAKGKRTGEILAALTASGVQVSGSVTVRPAELIPLEVLPKLAAAREGQPVLVENGDHSSLLTVLATKSEPVDESKAAAAIENFLANKQKSEAARLAVKQLRDQAKIEYVGEFANIQPNTQPPAPVETTVPAKAAEAGNDAAITKGIAGLK